MVVRMCEECPKCHKMNQSVNLFLDPICQTCVNLQPSVYFEVGADCAFCLKKNRPVANGVIGVIGPICIDCWKPDHRVCWCCLKYIPLSATMEIDGYRYCLSCLPRLVKLAEADHKQRQSIQLPTLYKTKNLEDSYEIYNCLFCYEVHRKQTHSFICSSCNDKLPEKEEIKGKSEAVYTVYHDKERIPKLVIRCSGPCKKHYPMTKLTERRIHPAQSRLYCKDCSICYLGVRCRKGEHCPFVHK